MRRALESLPPNDFVTIGSFARDLRWWSANRSVGETRKLNLPPADASANGPTNLQPALVDIVARVANTQFPTEVLILSDADAKIDDDDALGKQLADAKVRVSLLATGADLTTDNSVARIVNLTGGQLVRGDATANWMPQITELLRAAMPDLIVRENATVIFDGAIALPSRWVESHNRVWAKADGQRIARIDEAVAAAHWQLGAGSVVAFGFVADSREIRASSVTFARPPRDPRFAISRDEGANLHIAIDAIDNGKFLNGLAVQLIMREESNASPANVPFVQTAPGRYELTAPAPHTSKLATIMLDSRVIDRFALAGRYDREFDAIGNDRDAMRELARRTGGRVVEPADTQPLKLVGAARRIALASEFAFVGVAMIALGLIHWRRSTA
jgi:hypothetical protein